MSCSSAASCKAVGNYSYGTGSGASSLSRTLIESWNGKTWSVASNPSPAVAYLYGVSCSSATSCKAVGNYAMASGLRRTLVESWNGATWSDVLNPSPGVAYLYGVSCSSPRSCKAVGNYAKSSGLSPTDPLVEFWNGTAWST